MRLTVRISAGLVAVAATLCCAAGFAGAGREGGGGSLVRSFGDGGRVTTRLADSQLFIAGVGVERGGRIVAGGHAGLDAVAGGALTALRYTRSGRLDRRYGVRGRATARFSVPRTPAPATRRRPRASADQG